MKNRAIFVVVGGLVGLIVVSLSLAEEKKPVNEGPSQEVIAYYRNWTKVNSEPKPISPNVSFACQAVTLSANSPFKPDNPSPHRGKLVTVYVNELGQKAMTQKAPAFPVGTIVVKEKLSGKDATEPELLTVMVKRKPGYDAEHGDWEYLTLDGKASEITSRGKLENCRSCHEDRKRTDYVFRDYMTDKDNERLTALDKSTVPH